MSHPDLSLEHVDDCAAEPHRCALCDGPIPCGAGSLHTSCTLGMLEAFLDERPTLLADAVAHVVAVDAVGLVDDGELTPLELEGRDLVAALVDRASWLVLVLEMRKRGA